jgi:uncharacterized protein (TIGR00730 family)
MAAARRNATLFGGSQYLPGDKPFEDSLALGGALARAGWTVVNGGYGGTMLASARGAAEASGRAIGVGCSIFNCPLNEHITDPEVHPSLMARMERLIELGDAYIVMPGSTGTLAELAMVWELINKRLIPTRPILCWGDFWRPVVEVFQNDSMQDPRINTLGVVERRGALIRFVHSPVEAVAELVRALADA